MLRRIIGEAINKSSVGGRTTILNRAWNHRSETWKDNKAQMERAIPIFEALAGNDGDSHEVQGQLAFALKDKRNPDWSGAEKEFTRAIEMRGDSGTQGWALYEYSRAVCRIHLDPEREKGGHAAPETRTAIAADIKKVEEYEELKKWLREDPVVSKWLKHNKIDV